MKMVNYATLMSTEELVTAIVIHQSSFKGEVGKCREQFLAVADCLQDFRQIILLLCFTYKPFQSSRERQPLNTMVVLHTQPSASTAHKKNRRKISRKASRPAHVPELDEYEGHIGDVAMDPSQNIPSTSGKPDSMQAEIDDDQLMIDTDPLLPAPSTAPAFPPLPASAQRATLKSEMRRIPIPPHRMTPLKKDWVNIFSPLTEMLQLQVRMNVQRRCVEIRVRMTI